MISMKINSSNVDYVKKFTSEGLSKQSRIELIRKLRDSLGSDVFEFSHVTGCFMLGLE